MKTVIFFEPSLNTTNMGDHIIVRSTKKVLMPIFKKDFILECASHSPIMTSYQSNGYNPGMKVFDNADYKFVCGSNLLWKNMLVPRPSLNINIFNYRAYRNCILVGVGMKFTNKKLNFYTKHLYKKILSKNYIHSVRDEETKRFIESLGLKAINTGCTTLWGLDKEECKKIPTKKANRVIFTLTDYAKDREKDQQFINILNENYQEVFFWIQGLGDKEYFESFNNIENIKIVSPTLDEYEKVLNEGNIDYIGTRLHGGIFSMQHGIRTIILAVDNRVRDMKETYNLNTIERDNIKKLKDMINKELKTNIKMNIDNINLWLKQFREE